MTGEPKQPKRRESAQRARPRAPARESVGIDAGAAGLDVRPDLAEPDRLRGDEALLAALLHGSTLVDAAKAAKMAERTARRRVRNPEFRRRLDEGRAEVTAIVAAQLAGGAELGYGVLVELAGDVKVQASVRRRAASDLISLAGEIGAGRDVEARLEALEAALRAAGIQA